MLDVQVVARPADVVAAHRLRSAVLELARARATDRPLDPADVETLNGFAASAPPTPA
ncbi:hypothetical protein GCM10025868_28950 [Angustibacter aerolatus]|uniref:Uncharacterized protein n=1 Tax=Angustibacter aerolatus TaxID=1162965 RepID=A0ABQ6JHD7_9ACTN|nr:hypothetical protein GCM10025868_28950 [Angustibacter aerolatus]